MAAAEGWSIKTETVLYASFFHYDTYEEACEACVSLNNILFHTSRMLL